jgi:hypothetical protein
MADMARVSCESRGVQVEPAPHVHVGDFHGIEVSRLDLPEHTACALPSAV